MVISTVALGLFAVNSAGAGDGGGKFTLSGNSRVVVGGVGRFGAAVDLTSNCDNQILSDCINNFTFSTSDVDFTPKGTLTVSDITTLSTDYNFGAGNCGQESPRIEIRSGTSVLVCAPLGSAPTFTNCSLGWLNTGNWANTADTTIRWDNRCVGIQNLDWSGVLSNYGSQTVTEIDVMLDGGELFPQGQDLTIDNFTVNQSVLDLF